MERAPVVQKEVLRKVGSPTGSNQPYYSLMKSLLERVAPVMIDDQAITDLVALVRELIVGSGPIAEMVENSSGKGIQLLLVSGARLCDGISSLSHRFLRYVNIYVLHRSFPRLLFCCQYLVCIVLFMSFVSLWVACHNFLLCFARDSSL